MLGEIAYLKFNSFPHDATVGKQARDFLLAHADAKAIIFDCRNNRGGDALVMDHVLPLLFSKETQLVRMDTRSAADDGTPPSHATIRRPSPEEIVRFDHMVSPDKNEKRLQEVPIYYLISNKTGSAAEHIALALKRTKRAELIGETTAGYGHYGDLQNIGQRFSVFIPVGRTYDPDTNWDWEGVGIAPTIPVSADDALSEALRLANRQKN